jgi:hypothetical protein
MSDAALVFVLNLLVQHASALPRQHRLASPSKGQSYTPPKMSCALRPRCLLVGWMQHESVARQPPRAVAGWSRSAGMLLVFLMCS